jgi:uncharacterized protein YjiK
MPTRSRTTLFQPIFVMLSLAWLTGCSQDNSKNILFERPGYVFPYQLAEPSQTWKLPFELVEISGLGYIDDQRLACVQDEKGIIFIFNLEGGIVESQIVFGEDGDYEGIEIVGRDAWILKSNGTLFRVADFLEKKGSDVKKFPTALSGKNDAEGLAHDPLNQNLLIACKEHPFLDEAEGKNMKAIYSFNIESGNLDTKPFLIINPDTLRYQTGKVVFKPSGIAIQPATGHIFILGSAGKLLVVMSRNGDMQAMIKLNPMIFPQAEGICFSPGGTLYISNEGGPEGTILRFN